ncbi:MAG: glutaminyl-peptide cyclotransferase [Candidatus Thalassarchaeaceae archaeon]
MGRGTGPSIVPIAMLLILLSQMSMAEEGNNMAEERDIEILRTLPHDSSSFTQGLEVLENSIFESSGLYGHSRISEIDSQNGEIIRQTKIDDSYFGEGITVKDQSIIMLTWRAGVALEFHISNFSIIGNFSFEGEGWGICYNGEHIVTSNGTSELSFRDPDSFEIDFTTMVTWDGVPVPNLNELECVDDKIYANIWMEETILRISSTSGKVDFFSSPLAVTSIQGNGNEEVLNGIAFDQNSGSFWITGKNWTQMYLVNFTIPEEKLSVDDDSQLFTLMAIIVVTIVLVPFIFRIIPKKKDLETPNFKDSHR